VRGPTLTGLAVLSLAALGCGASTQTSAGDFKGPQHDVAQVIDDLGSASSGRDAKKICNNILAPALVARLRSAGGCEPVVARQLQTIDNFALKVLSVSPANPTTTATARVKSVRGGSDHVDTLTLTKAPAGWRLASLGP